MAKHNYNGWKPDKPDHRDYLYKVYRKSTGELPIKVDLRDKASHVLDQGNLGSCTAFALCAICEHLQIKNNISFVPLSELFLYYNERVLENSVKRDDGAEIRDGIKTLAKQGICSGKLWPYKLSNFRVKPTVASYKEALNHCIVTYYRLTTLIDFKQCLADGFSFCCGIALYDSFDTDKTAISGIIPYPSKRESLLGYHAISVFGYDDAKQCFICKNSWGEAWGENGWFYIPQKYMTNINLTDDAWTIRVEN